MPERRRVLWAAAKVVVAVAVLGFVLSRVDRAELAASVRGASWSLLAIATLFFVADDLLVTRKWNRLLQGVGIEVPFLRLLRVYLEGRFLGFFIPSSIASDLYKGAALTRAHGSGTAVASSIVLERILGLASIATLGVAAAAALPSRILGAGVAGWLLVAGVVTAAGTAAFLHADRIAVWFLPWLPTRWVSLRSFLEALARAFAAYRKHKRLLVETFVLSLLIQGTRSIGVYMTARAVADTTPLRYFLLLVPYVFLVNLLPVASSRIGLEQGVFVVLFAAVGMAPEKALAVSLLTVTQSLVVAVPGGIGLLARGRARESAR